MRNSKKIFLAAFLFAISLTVLPLSVNGATTFNAADCTGTATDDPLCGSSTTDSVDSGTINGTFNINDCTGTATDDARCNQTAPAGRDQTPNSAITRAFLKGAGYTAPASDMTCNINAQGVEVCVPSNDARMYVVAIIKFVLSVVGFLFFALLFYAGYLWTTAGGNEEAVKKAQAIATKAIIGLAMILAAYAITTFITAFLQKAVAP